MNKKFTNSIFLIFIITFSGCDLIEGIFKTGIWTILIGILLLVGLLYLIFSSVGYKPQESSSAIKK